MYKVRRSRRSSNKNRHGISALVNAIMIELIALVIFVALLSAIRANHESVSNGTVVTSSFFDQVSMNDLLKPDYQEVP